MTPTLIAAEQGHLEGKQNGSSRTAKFAWNVPVVLL